MKQETRGEKNTDLYTRPKQQRGMKEEKLVVDSGGGAGT